MYKKWKTPLGILLGIFIVNFGFSYYELSSNSRNQIIQILKNTGYSGYNVKSFNLPSSILFGSPVTAVAILEKNGGLIKINPTVTPLSGVAIMFSSEYYYEISGEDLMKLKLTNLSVKNPFSSAENPCSGPNIISTACFENFLLEIQNKTSGDMVTYNTNEWGWHATHLKGNPYTGEQDPSFNFFLSIFLPREILPETKTALSTHGFKHISNILSHTKKETNQFFIKSEELPDIHQIHSWARIIYDMVTPYGIEPSILNPNYELAF
jgi:hypothetical protein